MVKRTDRAARTRLEAVIAAGTLRLFAPRASHRDVENGLHDLASEEAIPLEQLRAVWDRYRVLIRMVDAPAASRRRSGDKARDPDNLPYIDFQVDIQADAIYTRHKDLSAINAPVVGWRTVSDARVHQRWPARSQTPFASRSGPNRPELNVTCLPHVRPRAPQVLHV